MTPSQKIKTIENLTIEFRENLEKKIAFDKKMREMVITPGEQKERYITIEKCKDIIIKKNSLKIKFLEELNDELDLLNLKIIALKKSPLNEEQKKKGMEQFSDHSSEIYSAISKINRF